MKEEKSFINALILILIISIIVSTLGLTLSLSDNISFIKVTVIFISFVLIILIISTIINIILLLRLFKGKKVSNISSKILYHSVSFYYPIMIALTKITKLDKDKIRLVFTKINNLLILSENIKVKGQDILVLLPHCLQDSECKHKITNNIENCKKCGKCDIEKIVELKEKYNINVVVATGGTLARRWIMNIRPKAIVAVACERDLSSGINDVKKLPVIGVLNERPNGPCFNTKVNIDDLERAIKFFLKEE